MKEPRELKMKKINDKLILSTDLKDRFNQEIYEGDIFYFDFDSSFKTFVFYNNGSFCFKTENNSILSINQEFANHAIIVGNIFGNSGIIYLEAANV